MGTNAGGHNTVGGVASQLVVRFRLLERWHRSGGSRLGSSTSADSLDFLGTKEPNAKKVRDRIKKLAVD